MNGNFENEWTIKQTNKMGCLRSMNERNEKHLYLSTFPWYLHIIFPYYFSISSHAICPNRVSVQGYHVYNSTRSHIFMIISISSHVINPGQFPLQGYIAHTSTGSHIFMISPFLVTLSAQTLLLFKVIMSISQYVPISSTYLHF